MLFLLNHFDIIVYGDLLQEISWKFLNSFLGICPHSTHLTNFDPYFSDSSYFKSLCLKKVLVSTSLGWEKPSVCLVLFQPHPPPLKSSQNIYFSSPHIISLPKFSRSQTLGNYIPRRKIFFVIDSIKWRSLWGWH